MSVEGALSVKVESAKQVLSILALALLALTFEEVCMDRALGIVLSQLLCSYIELNIHFYPISLCGSNS